MAYDSQKFRDSVTRTNLPTPGVSGYDSSAFRKANTRKTDLTTSEGLLNVAQQAGGSVANAAQDIANPQPGFFGKIGQGLKTGLVKTLDFLSRPNYAIATAVKNTIDDDPNTTFSGGLRTGITGQTKNTFHDVFTEAGWNPETRLGKIAKGASGFALDVLLDPTTYLTFGAGAGVKVGEETLTKVGREFLEKGLTQKGAAMIGEDAVKSALVNMAKQSPELYGKFLDKGGIKFFGNTLVSAGRIKGIVEALPGISKLDTATQPMRNTLYGLFNRDASKLGGKLPKEYSVIEQKFRDLGYVRTQGAITKAIDIAKANGLSSQEAEIITNAIETRLPLADHRLDNARKQIETVLSRSLKNEQRAGIAVGELPNYVPHILVETPTKNLNYIPPTTAERLGAKQARTIGKDEAGNIIKGDKGNILDASIKEINEAFGEDFFDPNIIRTTAIRSAASEKAVTTKEFVREVTAKFGKLADEAPSNYVESGVKGLEAYKFHPEIAEAMKTFHTSFISDEATNALLQQFDKLQNFWKGSVTQIFPAFHGRNAISNVFLNFLDIGADSINPVKHATAVDLLNKNRIVSKLERLSLGVEEGASAARASIDDLLAQPILKDVSGKTWTFGELRQVIQDNRVAFGNEFSGSADVRQTVSQALDKTSNLDKAKSIAQKVNPLSSENIGFKAGRTVGNTIEEQARLVNFVTNLQRTGDVSTAAGRVKQFLFDYQNLSPFEKNVMRRIVPFYTFTRKNLELQATQFVKQPGKFAGEAKLFHSISDLASGAGLSDDEQKNLPSFLQQGLGIVIGRDGKNLQILNSLGTPLEAVFGSLQKNAILGSLSPIIGIPLQLATQRNFFYDKPLDDVNDATSLKDAPQFIKDYIGFATRTNKDGSERYIALNPTRLFIISNMPPTARVLSSVRQLQTENVSGKLKVLQQFAGIKPYATNTDDNSAQAEKTKTRELQDLLDKSGTAPIFQKSFIPKEKIKIK